MEYNKKWVINIDYLSLMANGTWGNILRLWDNVLVEVEIVLMAGRSLLIIITLSCWEFGRWETYKDVEATSNKLLYVNM